MTKTVVGLFDTREAALHSIQHLTDLGIPRDQLSVLARGETDNDVNTLVDNNSTDSAATGATTGAIGGGVLGGALGLLVGIGALAIPGVGPVLAVGPLAAALGAAGTTTLVGAGIGAVSGGLLGALVGAGIPEEDASYYAEGLRRGGTLVVAHVDDTLVGQTYSVLRQQGAIDIDERGGEWRSEGWERFDPDGNAWERSSKVGTATGTAAGAVTGAAIGSVGGPVGTVVGGIAGAATGAAAGAAGDAIGEEATDDDTTKTTSYERQVGRDPVMSGANDDRPIIPGERRSGARIYGDGSRYDWDEHASAPVIVGTANTGGVVAPVAPARYTGDAASEEAEREAKLREATNDVGSRKGQVRPTE